MNINRARGFSSLFSFFFFGKIFNALHVEHNGYNHKKKKKIILARTLRSGVERGQCFSRGAKTAGFPENISFPREFTLA